MYSPMPKVLNSCQRAYIKIDVIFNTGDAFFNAQGAEQLPKGIHINSCDFQYTAGAENLPKGVKSSMHKVLNSYQRAYI